MCNPLLRAVLGLSIGVLLASGSALATASNEPGKKPVTKSVAAKKSIPSSKDAAARRARIKKIGSAATKEAPKASQPAKATIAGSSKKDHTADAQLASNSDGGSVAERRAHIHSMRVPE